MPLSYEIALQTLLVSFYNSVLYFIVCRFGRDFQKKIEKRGRKLVDYDSQRHNAQAIQSSANSAKKKDTDKAAKAREQLEEAKRTYELMNSELHDELPALYDSRVLFLVTNLQTYFAAEQIFHTETSKVGFVCCYCVLLTWRFKQFAKVEDLELIEQFKKK